MTEALKTRLAAEIAEHEKTHQRLRVIEKENANLRGLIGDQQRRLDTAVEMLHDAAAAILRAFPMDARPTDSRPSDYAQNAVRASPSVWCLASHE